MLRSWYEGLPLQAGTHHERDGASGALRDDRLRHTGRHTEGEAVPSSLRGSRAEARRALGPGWWFEASGVPGQMPPLRPA